VSRTLLLIEPVSRDPSIRHNAFAHRRYRIAQKDFQRIRRLLGEFDQIFCGAV
jgi:hypothetical protein